MALKGLRSVSEGLGYPYIGPCGIKMQCAAYVMSKQWFSYNIKIYGPCLRNLRTVFTDRVNAEDRGPRSRA